MITKKGTITSAKMKDTVTVTVHRSVYHPLYKKSYKMSKKFLADSKEFPAAKVGDEVLIVECRPLSKRKRFKITEILKASAAVSEMGMEKGLDAVLNRKKDSSESSLPGAAPAGAKSGESSASSESSSK
jgi:small subunit ribosomal protein S17